MGQYWRIVNIDKAQALRNREGLKLWELLSNCEAEQLVDLLKVPKLRLYHFGPATVANARAKSLALTCSYFFRLLAPAVAQSVVECEAPWAGNRLITVGDYANGVPCFLSPEDVRAIAARGADESEWDLEEDAETIERNPLYAMKTEEVSDRLDTDEISVEYRGPWCEFAAYRRRWGIPLRIRRLVHLRLSAAEVGLLDRLSLPPDFGTHHGAVLRCLELKEYVRDDFIACSEYAYSLGEVLSCFTRWTDDGESGRWAGRRFDITVQQHVDDRWRDVSEEAVEWLRDSNLEPRADGKRA
ncbi:hypothetical protein B0A55_00872 [Friedmanniomyces simplex]|uniref:Uncharacterized protein n=1 Tax=Friedmanniomyces simplex TaxID=329884 RepID=A0A4U0Y4H1_9PEZI|nr:hypothetical protein B0A55_00872 [Friedmanniomyces simplex]